MLDLRSDVRFLVITTFDVPVYVEQARMRRRQFERAGLRYAFLANGSRDAYARHSVANMADVWFTESSADGDPIEAPIADVIVDTTRRGLRRALDEDPGWKYAVRLNASTIVNPAPFSTMLGQLRSERLLAGHSWQLVGGLTYVSGTCMILSRDVAEILAENAPPRAVSTGGVTYWADDIRITVGLGSHGVPVEQINEHMYWVEPGDAMPRGDEMDRIVAESRSRALVRVKSSGQSRCAVDTAIWRAILDLEVDESGS